MKNTCQDIMYERGIKRKIENKYIALEMNLINHSEFLLFSYKVNKVV